jgi:hypothetical protein
MRREINIREKAKGRRQKAGGRKEVKVRELKKVVCEEYQWVR